MSTLGPWDALLVLSKACVYAGTFAAGGGVWFLAYSRDLLGAGSARIRLVIRVGLCLALLASAAKVLLTAVSMAGDASGALDPGLDAMVVQGAEGWALVMRVTGLLAMARVSVTRTSVTALLGSVAAVTSFAWVGHVHALPSHPPIGLLIVHLLAVAFWVGALTPLYLTIRRERISGEGDLDRLALLVSRFGRWAVPVVGILVLVGAGIAWLLLRDADWGGDYARMLLGKLFAVVGLLSLAALNHRRLTPRLLAGDRTAVSALRRSLVLEMVFAAAVLLITASMTTLAGP